MISICVSPYGPNHNFLRVPLGLIRLVSDLTRSLATIRCPALDLRGNVFAGIDLVNQNRSAAKVDPQTGPAAFLRAFPAARNRQHNHAGSQRQDDEPETRAVIRHLQTAGQKVAEHKWQNQNAIAIATAMYWPS